jgi:hypothetical protein
METTQQAKNFQFIGRCNTKGCKAVFHREVQGELRTGHDYYLKPFKFSKPIWPNLEIYCVTHKRRISWSMVKGTVAPEHKCDIRCTSARGNNCECSCGGKNHGKDHAI